MGKPTMLDDVSRRTRRAQKRNATSQEQLPFCNILVSCAMGKPWVTSFSFSASWYCMVLISKSAPFSKPGFQMEEAKPVKYQAKAELCSSKCLDNDLLHI